MHNHEKLHISLSHPGPNETVAPFEGLEDRTIWTMFKKGHEGAFNHIYRTYFDIICDYGFLFTKNEEIIKDCIQDLFVELRSSGPNLSDTDQVKYYLFKCFRYKVSRELKKRKLLSFMADVSSCFQLDFVVSHESRLVKEQFDQEVKRKLTNALNQLPKRQKEAVYYFYYEDFSYQQLTAIMGLNSVKSARNLVYKALKKLRNAPQLSG